MKKIFALCAMGFLVSCNDATNKAETTEGTEISTPSVSDSSGAGRDTAGAGLGADTTRPRTNTADN